MIWVLENIKLVAACWGILVAICSAIVEITPTQKDNNILAKVVKFADLFSVRFRKEDAETLAKALKKRK